MFLVESESFLTLHGQQCSWNILWPRNIVRTSLGCSVLHRLFKNNYSSQWFLLFLVVLHGYSRECSNTCVWSCWCKPWNARACVVVLFWVAVESDQEEKKSLKKVVILCAQSILVTSYHYGWITDVTWTILQISLLCFWALNVVVPLLSVRGRGALGFSQGCLNLCFKVKWRTSRFWTKWGWVINDRIWLHFILRCPFYSVIIHISTE